MPKMPDWAEGARIVYDTTLPLAFIRRGARRGVWAPYALTQKGGLKLLGTGNRKKLEDTRHGVLEALGESIQTMVMGLHPGARQSHLYGAPGHVCGAPYSQFKTVYSLKEVSCPICLSVVEEQVKKAASEVGSATMDAARERVRTVDTLNGLGQIVTDGKEKVQY